MAVTAQLVTSPARGGIAVIVLSGPEAAGVLGRVFVAKFSRRLCDQCGTGETPVLPGVLSLGRIVDGEQTIDEAIVALAGERIEINIHGGPQAARAVLALLARQGAAIRPEAGGDAALAFAHPAHDNPAIAAEAAEALLAAATPLAATAVAAQWSGGLSALAANEDPSAQALRQAAAALPQMLRLLDGAEVVVAGAPNVGKSTLANALAGRQVAIVSDIPGTTRDWVRSLVDIDGLPVHLTDTAGLWDSPGHHVDRQAVERALERIERADLVVLVHLPQEPPVPGQEALLSRLAGLPHVLSLQGKCDRYPPQPGVLGVSGVTLAGLAQLRAEIRRRLGMADFAPALAMAFTQRQQQLLLEAAGALESHRMQDARGALDRLLGR